jgi:hypothetical protein
MKDILQDIVGHTHTLGLSIVKISGDDNETKIDSMADDRSVIMMGQTNAPIPQMKGIFGMPQLSKLKYLIDCFARFFLKRFFENLFLFLAILEMDF